MKAVKIKEPIDGYQNKLKGYISKVANRPSTFNSDHEFDGKSFKMYADGGKKVLNFDNLYFSLYPEIDMLVRIKASFGEQKFQMNEAYINFKKHKQDKLDELALACELPKDLKELPSGFGTSSASFMNSHNQIKLNFQSLKEKRREFFKSEDSLHKDIQLENINFIPNKFDKFDKIIKQKNDSQAKKMEVQVRKNQLQLGKSQDLEMKNRLSNLRSIFQSEKKKLMERNSKFQLWQLVWIKFIKQVLVSQTLHDKIEVLTSKRKICHQAKVWRKGGVGKKGSRGVGEQGIRREGRKEKGEGIREKGRKVAGEKGTGEQGSKD